MRIAFVYDAVYPYVAGGVERRNHELATRLARRGHDVHIVSWQHWDGAGVKTDDGVTLHGTGRAPSMHDASGRRTFREALAFAARSAPIIARINADVIDCASIPYVPAFAAAAAGSLRRTPIAVTWHEYMGDRWRAYAGRRAGIASLVERRAARVGTMRIAVSAFTARRLPAGPRTEIVENGVDCARIDALAATAERFDVVCAGRLVPHKRVDLLLDALALLPDVTGAIIGDGSERVALEARARDLGVAGRVRFLGRVERADDVSARFKAAKAVVVPSEQEGFAMTALEAQACGAATIVVRADDSAAADLVRDGVDGIIADSSALDLACAIKRVVRYGKLRERLGANAVAAARHYDWDDITTRLERVYKSMLAERVVAVREQVEEAA